MSRIRHNDDEIRSVNDEKLSFRFSTLHLFYLVSLIAAAFALFESYAPFWLAGVGIFWLLMYVLCSVAQSPIERLGIILFLVFLFFFLGTPRVQRVREAARRTVCLNHVRQLGLALQNYQCSHMNFPPSYLAGKDGQRLHSWRSLILSELEEIDIYNRIDFTQPWDSPANSKLVSWLGVESVFFCPLQDRNSFEYKTPYKLVTGTGTAFEHDQAVTSAQIPSPSNTIAIIEDVANPVCWMQPKDLSFEEAVRLFDINDAVIPTQVYETKFFRRVYYHRMIGLLDGSVRSVGGLEDPSQIVPYLLLDHPDKQDFDELDFVYPEPSHTVLYSGYILLAFNVVLAVLPCFWRKLQPFGSEPAWNQKAVDESDLS